MKGAAQLPLWSEKAKNGESPARRRRLPRTLAQVLPAVAVIAWRAWSLPLTDLWRDWLTLMGLFWVFTSLHQDPMVRTRIALGLMAFLMTLYLRGQIPYMLNVLGITR